MTEKDIGNVLGTLKQKFLFVNIKDAAKLLALLEQGRRTKSLNRFSPQITELSESLYEGLKRLPEQSATTRQLMARAAITSAWAYLNNHFELGYPDIEKFKAKIKLNNAKVAETISTEPKLKITRVDLFGDLPEIYQTEWKAFRAELKLKTTSPRLGKKQALAVLQKFVTEKPQLA